MNQKIGNASEIILIDRQVGGKRQRSFLRSVFAIDDTRFLIDIKVDSVVEQSHAIISNWKNGAWCEVYALHPSEMKIDFNMGYKPEPINELLFDAVTSRLIRVARDVCF